MFPKLLQPKFLFVDILILVILFVPFCFYLRAMQKALASVSKENRKMPPSEVWITAIPVFGAIWHFFVVNAIADSLRLEFLKYNILLKNPRPTFNLGFTASLLATGSVIPTIGIVLFVAALVCGIIYWVQVNDCINRIELVRKRNTGY